MAREFAKKFYNSKAWINCREAYKQSKHGLCERCGMPGDEVHHKIHLNPDNINNPDITLNWNNLELLCMSCHSVHHMTKHSSTMPGYSFNENGDLTYTPPIKKH
ncbi:HNH endonuclease [Defluviitalea saccharophila]|uniref:HNH endonuclease n=2 Tax=Defluviitalea saccharophila TaxID=879970 RepID=A0ABZ2Y5M3_9FIRM